MNNGIRMQKDSIKLYKVIKEISGDKIVTIYKNDGQCCKFDMTDQNFTLTSKGLENLFAAKILSGMINGGSIIIRQFTQEKIDDIPIKNIYGIRLGYYSWNSLSAQELETAYSFDSITKKTIPKEKDIVYCSLIRKNK